jgi:two-component system chemotaxis response regulator CheB
VDVLAKPQSAWNLGDLREQLALRVKGAAGARLKNFAVPAQAARTAVTTSSSTHFSPRQIVLIGASTGGTEAIKNVLTRLPDRLPGICIVQHIPPVFSKTFAERLNEYCAFEVREAEPGDELKSGLALVAPGDQHLTLAWTGAAYRVALQRGPLVHHVRPAVDVMFESAVGAGKNTLAVLLTGMGRDGAAGMKKLKTAGATTLAQNEETCVVYGMPRAAVELGAVERVLPLDLIPHAILHALQNHSEIRPSPICPDANQLIKHTQSL